MSKFENLNISCISEDPRNPRQKWDNEGLKELADSITEKGVLQPVLVIPLQGEQYQLVFGHRRFRASKLAGKLSIPAVIRDDLTADEALELQITENLLREDVHPLDESIAFQRLIDERHYSIEEIAAKLGKSQKYIVQRLKLNDLTEDLQVVFHAGKLFINQAFEISRMSAVDQTELYNRFIKGKWNRDPNFTPDGLKHTLGWYIKETRMDLAGVPWALDDAVLVKDAGPCSRCPKNTACNIMLFPDMEVARCTDRQCYTQKLNAHLDAKIKDLQTEGEEVLLLKSYGDTDDKRFKEAGHAVLKQFDNFEEVRTPSQEEIASGAVMKGLWVGSRQTGNTTWVKLKANGKVNQQTLSADSQIFTLKEREKRAKELDHVKVFKRIYDLMLTGDYSKMAQPLLATEAAAIILAMLRQLSGEVATRYFSITKERYEPDYTEYLYTAICKHIERHDAATTLRTIQRVWMIDKLYAKDLSHENNAGNRALYLVAEIYYDKEVTEYNVEQAAIREKREKKVMERIAALATAMEPEPEKSKKVKSTKRKEAINES